MKDPNKISEEKVTAPALYFNRRAFIRAGILAASAVGTGKIYRHLNPVAKGKLNTSIIGSIRQRTATLSDADGFRVSEPRTSFEDITHYNNFQEFSSDKCLASFNTSTAGRAVEENDSIMVESATLV